MTLVRILLGALVASGLLLVVRWTMETRRVAARVGGGAAPTPLDLLIGFVTNFFDTLGIGSFATTTAVFRLFRLVPDELIPGTIIVGHALPVVTQALLFISVVDVDPWQMTVLIVGLRDWRVDRRGSRRLAVTPRGAARHGVRAAGGRRVHAARHARPVPGGRHRARLHAAGVRRSRSWSTSSWVRW